jgi:hypothetical protein
VSSGSDSMSMVAAHTDSTEAAMSRECSIFIAQMYQMVKRESIGCDS